MSDATLTTPGPQGAAVRLERVLPDPPEVVWQALTDRDQLKAWFPCDVIVEGGLWRPGAAITFPFGPEADNVTLTGEVLEVREPELLAFTWAEETLRFELVPHDGGTRLILVDELRPGIAARNAAGWDVCLDRLAGRTPAQDAWRAPFERYTAAFTPELGPQEGPPESAQ
ncbi:MAG: ATPase [Catenulispora sp.]|nr:ATPase [Catenulispora sp.]